MITRLEAEFDDSPLCIGQSLSEQHAMRASGVAAQPAQSATLPATSANTATKADARLNHLTTAYKDEVCAANCQRSTKAGAMFWVLRKGPAFASEWRTGS